MKVTITQIKAYRIDVNGEDLGTFIEASTWHGMQELKNDKGETLIVEASEGGFSAAFGALFGAPAGVDAQVIKASPSLAAKIRGKDEHAA